jgi:hypothetical protein
MPSDEVAGLFDVHRPMIGAVAPLRWVA